MLISHYAGSSGVWELNAVLKPQTLPTRQALIRFLGNLLLSCLRTKHVKIWLRREKNQMLTTCIACFYMYPQTQEDFLDSWARWVPGASNWLTRASINIGTSLSFSQSWQNCQFTLCTSWSIWDCAFLTWWDISASRPSWTSNPHGLGAVQTLLEQQPDQDKPYPKRFVVCKVKIAVCQTEATKKQHIQEYSSPSTHFDLPSGESHHGGCHWLSFYHPKLPAIPDWKAEWANSSPNSLLRQRITSGKLESFANTSNTGVLCTQE